MSEWPLLDHRSCSRGLVVAISPYLQNFFVGNSCDPTNRCIWITLVIQDRLLGFCLVYAPNLSSDQSHLWDWMASSWSYANWILVETLIWLNRMVIKEVVLVEWLVVWKIKIGQDERQLYNSFWPWLKKGWMMGDGSPSLILDNERTKFRQDWIMCMALGTASHFLVVPEHKYCCFHFVSNFLLCM